MAWRLLEHGEKQWSVSMAAERRPNSSFWNLVLSFRPVGDGQQRSFWAAYPLESSSRSMLFAQAEKIPDQRLAAVLAEHLS